MLGSDWSAYELDDIVWDDFGEVDDHIVLHPRCTVYQDSLNKRSYEFDGFPEYVGEDRKCGNSNSHNGKDGSSLYLCTKDGIPSPLFENSQSTESGLGRPSQPTILKNKEVGFVKDHDGVTSSFISVISASDSLISSRNVMNCSELCQIPLGDISLAETDLDLFGTELDDKESCNFLGYDWPNIENFDDVDHMFRNSDSTFGQVNAENPEQTWMSSSSGVAVGSEAKSRGGDDLGSFSFKGDEAQRFNALRLSDCTSDPSSSCDTLDISCTTNSQHPEHVLNEHSGHCHASFQGYFGVKTEKIKGTPKEKVQHQPDRKRKAASSNHTIASSNNGLPYRHLGYYLGQSNLVSPDLRSVKSGIPVPVHMTPEEKIEKLRRRHQMRSSLNIKQPKTELPSRTELTSQSPSQRRPSKLYYSSGGDSMSGIHNIVNSGTETNSAIRDNGSCLSTMDLDEIAFEETCLCQLQKAVAQLDDQTKRCIRDSLNRLANSWIRRNTVSDTMSSSKSKNDTDGVMAFADVGYENYPSSRCGGVVDMETVTNPIDRSLAHLLFHQPSPTSSCLGKSSMPTRPSQSSWPVRFGFGYDQMKMSQFPDCTILMG